MSKMHSRVSNVTILFAALFLAYAEVRVHGGILVDGPGDRKLKFGGESDGTGSLPFVGPTSPHFGSILNSPTIGQVVNAQQHGVAGATIIATHPVLGVVGITITDCEGFFELDLPQIQALEIAIPENGIAGINITAGEQVLIVIP